MPLADVSRVLGRPVHDSIRPMLMKVACPDRYCSKNMLGHQMGPVHAMRLGEALRESPVLPNSMPVPCAGLQYPQQHTHHLSHYLHQQAPSIL
eukprot:scaffold136439_cov50-Prasinocladus_malaysianus.AAC.1